MVGQDVTLCGVDDDAGARTAKLAALLTVRRKESPEERIVGERIIDLTAAAHGNVNDGRAHGLDEWRQCRLIGRARELSERWAGRQRDEGTDDH